MMKKFILLGFLFVQGCSWNKKIHEYDSFNFQCSQPAYYGFINGVNTSQRIAQRSVDRLNRITNKKFDLIYNTSENVLRDIGQALAQKKSEYNGDGIILSGAFVDSLIHHLRDDKNIYLPEEINEINMVVDELKNRNGLIVAHSQGNLFANYICKQSKSKPSVVQVANPSSIKTECENLMVTFDNDPVISLVSLIANSTGSFALSPRKANDHFEEGQTIKSALLEIYYMSLKDGSINDKTKEIENIIFYNHDFISYLKKDMSSSKKILGTIKNTSFGKKTKEQPFSIAINRRNTVPQIIKSSWGVSGGNQIFASCTHLLENEGGYVFLSPGPTGVDENQLIIYEGIKPIALKRIPGSPVIAGIIEKVDEKGNFVLRSSSIMDVVKKMLKLIF